MVRNFDVMRLLFGKEIRLINRKQGTSGRIVVIEVCSKEHCNTYTDPPVLDHVIQCGGIISRMRYSTLEIFIPFEKFKRLNKRKYFVIPTVSHKLHIFVTYKRLIWIQFDPFAHYNIINEVAHNSYNKIFPFGTPFAFLKRNKNFQCSSQ